MKIASTNGNDKISGVDITSDVLSGRGGLSFILNYIDGLGFFDKIETQLGHLRKSTKADTVSEVTRQIMAYFINGEHQAISGFDALHGDEGYAAVLERNVSNVISSATVKRFFGKFNGTRFASLRSVLNDLFVWRLNEEKPASIVLHLDTMILDNNDAKKREGSAPTYKKVCGFQPLQINWGPYIIDVHFRSGEKHSNHGNDAKYAINRIVSLIREQYDADIPIIVCADSGFLSEENLRYFEDELKIHYVVIGKMYQSIYRRIEELAVPASTRIDKGTMSWQCRDFSSKLDSWEMERRTVLSSLVCNNDQCVLEGIRDTVMYTNLGTAGPLDSELILRDCASYITTAGIIALTHHNGEEELNHRSIKDFITSEHLPFKRFGMNGAYYLLMTISHFMMEAFRKDVVDHIIPKRCYPQRLRREIIDIAVKIVRTGRKTILKATQSIWNRLDLGVLWQKCKREPVWV